jgi:PilZ domain
MNLHPPPAGLNDIAEYEAMREELRKHRRQKLHYNAYVDLCDGMPVPACRLVDVSEHGAQLTLASAADLPDQFVLLLAESGKVRRQCRVAWRSEKQLGVQFVAGPPRKATTYPAVRERV